MSKGKEEPFPGPGSASGVTHTMAQGPEVLLVKHGSSPHSQYT